MSLRDPLAQARGLGSAKDGVQHWWLQRVTAVALMVLTPWFLWFALSLAGADQVGIRFQIARPLNAALLSAFVLALLWHARLGLQVVVEDYVHGWLEIAAQIAIKFAYAFAAIASLLAIVRIVVTA
jgi:succinate dehydrogenase / fumarate reductase membrane anchor subunit